MSEVNVNWRIVEKKKSLRTLVRGWFEQSNVSIAHNTINSTKYAYQPGGVAIINAGETATKVIKAEPDRRYMGRWCSSLYQGKNGMKLRVVSIYLPSARTSSGSKTILEQQKGALLKSKITQGVLDTYWKDLWKDIDTWIANDEQIIIGGDWNMQVQSKELLDGFKERKMKPVIQAKFPGELPPTYNRGSKALDEIFFTENVKINKCGYMQHGILASDHCPIWIEIDKKSVLGSKTGMVQKLKARRLKNNNPDIVNKYNHILEEELSKRNVYKRASKLFKTFKNPLTIIQEKIFNAIDKDREESMQIAERKCRKLHMGAVQWSPAIQKVRTKIYYLKLCVRKKKGV